MNFLSKPELIKVLKIAKAEDITGRDHLMILMAYTHAMRPSELVNVRMGDIKDETIKVRRLKNSKTTTQELRHHPGNPLLDELRSLKGWLQVRPTNAGDFLFPVSYKTFYRLFATYTAKAGIGPEAQHPHVLRHSHATHMAQKGVNSFGIQRRLGHASITSTAQYVHLQDQEIDETVNDMMMESF